MSNDLFDTFPDYGGVRRSTLYLASFSKLFLCKDSLFPIFELVFNRDCAESIGFLIFVITLVLFSVGAVEFHVCYLAGDVIDAIASGLGTEEFLFSTLAAIAVRASAAFSAMVVLFMSGLLPMVRLKHRVDLSASLMASLNFLILSSSGDSTFLVLMAGLELDPENLPLSSAVAAYSPPDSFFLVPERS